MAVSPTRACDGCNAFCKTPDINEPDFKKPLGTWCTHCVIGQGCGIYATRPKVCRSFFCQWSLGMGSEEDRPDKVGFILDFVPRRKGNDFNIVQIFEVDEGSLEQPLVQEWTRESLESDMLVVHRYLSGDNVSFVPDSLREAIGEAGVELVT